MLLFFLTTLALAHADDAIRLQPGEIRVINNQAYMCMETSTRPIFKCYIEIGNMKIYGGFEYERSASEANARENCSKQYNQFVCMTAGGKCFTHKLVQ